jgi:hypothetical protein
MTFVLSGGPGIPLFALPMCYIAFSPLCTIIVLGTCSRVAPAVEVIGDG